MDSSQNSTSEKQTLNKIQYEENGLHKIQYEENGLFTKFNMRKTDSSQNLIAFMFTFFGGRRAYPPFF